MEMGLRRKPKTGVVVAGSVWESRMKSDEYNGNEEDDSKNNNNDSQGNDDDDDDSNKITIDEVHQVGDDSKKVNLNMRSPSKHNVVVGTMTNGNGGGIGKRRTWKSESLDMGDPIQIAATKQRSDMVKKIPIHNTKTISVMVPMKKEKELSLSIEVVENKKTRSQSIMPPTPNPESRKSKSESDENAKHCEENDERRIEKGGLVGVRGENTISEEKDISSSNVLVVYEKNSQTQHSTNLRKPTIRVPVPVPHIVKKQSPSNQPSRTSKSKPNTNESHRMPTTHSKMQSIVDLVMWRDVSRTAFVFGIGTFFVISSSYTKDLNISFISVISYVGLVYLAAIFLFRSFISRGNEMNDSNMDYVFGEEEAIRLVKLTLPYVNECLMNLKALFSGDPATTFKMALMLYVLARCGSSITIWKMAKLSFFGVFTIPKICSSYSKHLTNYGAIWIGRIREGWKSCSHKKAVGFAIFTLFWNLSSYIARIWAIFVLFVAFRIYHQQSMVEEEEEEARSEYPSQRGCRQHTMPVPVDTGGKQKKIY